ncbi:hypothetical protein Clacol_004243 [Clathrus columnatus]|uniref:DUF6570 domain-containing protein n=1 Tax=Clathrus columnatus TaxID=1419009 RepID=A0AAV5A908_9AGAM|nr:hypothetical protein Clacol_004243 [Clathrus columnatus]
MKRTPIEEIPNASRLTPTVIHEAMTLTKGLLLERAGIIKEEEKCFLHICHECEMDLQKPKPGPPKYLLANDLWIGEQPPELYNLNFPEQLLISLVYPQVFVFKLYPKFDGCPFDEDCLQRGMQGTVSSYELDTEGIASMVDGNLLPRPLSVLADLISVTFIGWGQIPKKYLQQIFRVHRSAVQDALCWLKINNQYFAGIIISDAHLNQIPEDAIPDEIFDVMHQFEDEDVLGQEDDSYVRRESITAACDKHHTINRLRENEGFDIDDIDDMHTEKADIDLSKLSVREMEVWALSNLWNEGREGGYEIRHGSKPVKDYNQHNAQCPKSGEQSKEDDDNYWEKTFPFLFPYG